MRLVLLLMLSAPLWAQSLPTSTIDYLPKWYGSLGAGAVIPGSSKFGYEAIATFVGQASYVTAVNEYTFTKGTVQSCALGGVSKVLYQFGAFSIGTTGLAGGCTTVPTSGGAAAAVQGFLSYRVRKSGISLLLTGDKTFTVDGRQAAKLTFGVSYGR
jgi:hypothetical protein